MAWNRDRTIRPARRIIKQSFVCPPLAFVEGPGSIVARYNSKPGDFVSASANLPFRFVEQNVGHPGATVVCGHVHLLDFVVDDHHKPGNRIVDGQHGGIGNPLPCPLAEQFRSPYRQESIWDVPKMAVSPTLVPDRGYRGRIGRGCLADMVWPGR